MQSEPSTPDHGLPGVERVPTDRLADLLDLGEHYRVVRAATEALCQGLSAEDQCIQSMPDASPTKWHLAHTTWFFENFLLAPRLGFRPFHPSFGYLFNSYYESVGPRYERPRRGLLSRPGIEVIHAYRRHVDQAMGELLEEPLAPESVALVALGINHEQQHQELILTDIAHAFWCNPLRPAYRAGESSIGAQEAEELRWFAWPEGIHAVGTDGSGFSFDNERPRHLAWVPEVELASRLVTCGEYLAFIDEGGYRRPELWLSDGWRTVKERGWAAPLYWELQESGWWQFTPGGMRPVAEAEPVAHVSLYEADAYARWAGARLPSEEEWERAAAGAPVSGNLAEQGRFHPAPASPARDRPAQLFGDLWEWTRSSYGAYPGYRPAPGALGEYNGKFMCNQMVLRGGSCATPASHLRASYRNFFPPDARWQLSGIRLAKEPTWT